MSPRFSDVVLRTQTDERLADLARNGHERAFGVLVERYRGPLLHMATGLVGANRAEDVAQQSLLRAWSALRSGTQVGHVSGWLHQIVRHTAYSEHARSREHGPLPEDLADPRSSVGEAEPRLALAALLTDMASLPEHQRTALAQTELGGRSRRDIAADMGLTEGAVRQLLHRARTTLRTAATAITPLPLAAWAARPSMGSSVTHHLSMLGGQAATSSDASTGTAGALLGTGTLIKAGAVVLAAGAVSGGLAIRASVTAHPHRGPARLSRSPHTAGISNVPLAYAARGPDATLAGASGSLRSPSASQGAANQSSGHSNSSRADTGPRGQRDSSGHSDGGRASGDGAGADGSGSNASSPDFQRSGSPNTSTSSEKASTSSDQSSASSDQGSGFAPSPATTPTSDANITSPPVAPTSPVPTDTTSSSSTATDAATTTPGN